MGPAPLPLAYDDLPPGSDIRRDFSEGDDNRSAYLTVPASAELPAAVMKQAMLDAMTSSVPLSIALLIVSYLAFAAGLRINRIAGPTLPWAWGFFALFCVALVGLIAWVRYGVLADAIRLGREQGSVIAVTPQRLLIETTGPFGVASYDLPAERVTSLSIVRGSMRDDRGTSRKLWHLALHVADGKTILILPGRDQRELAWVVGTISAS